MTTRIVPKDPREITVSELPADNEKRTRALGIPADVPGELSPLSNCGLTGHKWETYQEKEGLKHCSNCDRWLIITGQKVVFLPPPEVMRESRRGA